MIENTAPSRCGYIAGYYSYFWALPTRQIGDYYVYFKILLV